MTEMATPDLLQRTPLACEICRKRKRKCDGIQPMCTWCIQKRLDCHYVLDRPKRKRQDHGYVNDLESQVQLLKEEIRRLRNLHPVLAGSSHLALDFQDAEQDDSRLDPESQEDPISIGQNAAIDDMSMLMWRLTVQDGGETSFIGPSSNFCFVPDRSSLQRSEHGSATSMDALVQDDSKIASKLVELFDRHINTVHQFVDSSVIRDIASGTRDDGDFLKCAILAAASLFSSEPGDKRYGSSMARFVESQALQMCRIYPRPETVQALSIMCWRELGLNDENMAWMYNSMAVGLALHLGLHVSSLRNLKQNASTEASELVRLRTFWSTVLIDRIATSLLGRNCMLPWKRAHASPAVNLFTVNPTLDELVFDHHCRLWFIHDQYMDRIYAFDFERLDGAERQHLLLEAREQLLSFHRNLDDRVQLRNAHSEATVIIFHMSYHMSHLLIHRPYLKEPSGCATHQLSLRSMFFAASAIARLVRKFEADHHNFNLVPPFVVHSVQSAAIALLMTATSTQSQVRSQSINRLRVCIRALEAMNTRWPTANRAICVLRLLAHRWHIISALPMHLSSVLETKQTESSLPEVGMGSRESGHTDGIDMDLIGHYPADIHAELSEIHMDSQIWNDLGWDDLVVSYPKT
ncbi:hypothetical protein B0I35DRAFT_420624 [Stachybotrys elegans]|uniref:Zn(2)-C6 fungal-type domain-containing protein n=1 Tax=Stachybotrys elegans TaxID=80388 RepID=A0A8K0WXW5_9HYPO|nr:hypothetical protein B0I35DRAFT_420624 [Stachybotrys elegans]